MKQKYISGDLVKAWIGINTGSMVAEVVGYNPLYQEYILTNWYIEETRGVISITEDRITPISLTPNILKKNGWDKDDEDKSIFYLSEAFLGGDKDDEDNYTCFQLYYQNENDGWIIDMRGELLKFDIHYVHELQHLLFGLGINHEMEV